MGGFGWVEGEGEGKGEGVEGGGGRGHILHYHMVLCPEGLRTTSEHTFHEVEVGPPGAPGPALLPWQHLTWFALGDPGPTEAVTRKMIGVSR